MPSVQRAHEALKDHDVVVLTISIDGSGERAVKPFLAEYGYTVPALVDPRMEVARAFGIRAVPTTIVVNRAGAIMARGTGPFEVDKPEFIQYVESLLGQPRGVRG
jgi:peroxiredoxin